MPPPRYLKEKLLPILVNRTSIFLIIMCLLTLFLYLTGTIQGFADTTQFVFLRLYAVLAIFLTTTSICGIVINFLRFKREKKARYFLRAGLYFLLVVFCAVTVLAVLFVFVLAKGTPDNFS